MGPFFHAAMVVVVLFFYATATGVIDWLMVKKKNRGRRHLYLIHGSWVF